MTRLLAALLVLGLALSFSWAQERPTFGRGVVNLPFEVVTVDGKTGWKVTGRGTVSLDDLVGGLANATGLRVSFSANAMEARRTTLSYIAPDAGMTLSNAELAGYTGELLGGQGLTLVGFTTGSAKVARIEEAASHAIMVGEAELGAMHASEWVTFSASFVHLSPRAASNALSLYRGADMTIVGHESGAVLTGRAERVRTAMRLLREMDKPAAASQMVRAYDLPEGVKAESARALLGSLFPGDVTEVQNIETRVTVTTRQQPRVTSYGSLTGNRLIVAASPQDHTLVAQALASMK
ncbi:hypothetical protein EDM80_04240 [bacterium]|nr:MAG: hypothetical protein EDM80_04240 [bacterium]RIK61623.1 MAG: hypothetical protein DCC64_12975 [Planctomycetota bacterium]